MPKKKWPIWYTVCPVPETFGDYIRNLVKFSDYISKFGQFGYSLILTLLRNIVKFWLYFEIWLNFEI